MKAKVAGGSVCFLGVVNLGWTPQVTGGFLRWVGYMPKVLLALQA